MIPAGAWKHKSYDVCMISTRHPLFEQRIYHKEATSLRKKLGLKVLVIYFDTHHEMFQETEQADVLVLRKKRNNPAFFIRKLREVTKELDVNTYHIHDFDALALIPYLKRRRKSKVVYDVHENYQRMIRQASHLSGAVKRLIVVASILYERHYSRKADHIITVVEHHEQKFRKWGFKKGITCIKNHPKTEIYKDGKTKKKYDFVYCGTVSEDRGVSEFLDFMKAYKEEGFTARIVMTGRPEERRKIKDKVKSSGLQEQVTLKEKLPFKEIPGELAKARIGFVLFHDNPKRTDGFSTKLIEYAATGLPSITTSYNKRMKAFIDTYHAGVTIDKITPKRIREAYDLIMGNYEEFSKNSKKGAKENSWKKEEEKLVGMYKKLLQVKR
ncbi:MAG: glycosyltransferase family 4 protein [Candidatus Woesearchaeota archaeon]